jgi:hypothetical protein
VDLIVQNPDGQQTIFSDGYTYINNPQPLINNSTPVQGSSVGNTNVTIYGKT